MTRSKMACLLERFTRDAKLRRAPIRNQPHPRVLLGLLCLEDRTVPAVLLGTTANSFAVLGGSTVTNTGPSVITGDLGVGPGTAVTGFPPGLVLAPGTVHAADAVALQAQTETTTAYNLLAGLPATGTLTGQDLGGRTLLPGVYFFANSAQLTGTLTLDGQGDPNATFVFQIGSTLTTASSSSVVFVNGATQQEVYWQVGSSATLGTATQFAGNILALTSISFGTGASISCGRALARNGAVTLDTNSIVNDCANTPGSISGRKFEDLNGDGLQQPGDPGLSGATVYLDANGNSSLDAGEPFTISDATGFYTFANLVPGTYQVLEAPRSDLLQTTASPLPITLTSGQDVTGVDFGDFRLVSLGGLKFNDLNGDGVRDAGDAGVAGVTVFLDANGNGTLDAGEVSTVTAAGGTFTFTNVGPGIYRIREVQPAGTVRTSANPADIATASGSNVGGVLLGNFSLVSLGGLKFNDLNGDGVRDAGDAGVAGVTVFLDANGNGTLDAGEVSTVTAAGGTFTFTNVGPGIYRIREMQPAGTVRTSANPADIATTSGGNVGGVLFGNFRVVSPQPVPLMPPLTPFTIAAPPVDVSKRMFLSNTPDTTPPAAMPPGRTVPDFAALGSVSAGGRPTFVATAEGAGGELVRVFDLTAGRERFRFVPFPGNPGGVRVAMADLTGDGIPDIVAGAGPGGTPRVIAYDGNTGAVLFDFLAFEASFAGGVYLAAGDFDADGRADLVVTPDEGGGPRVRVLGGGDPGRVLADFWGIADPDFRGGVRATTGDVNRDGFADLIVSAGFGGGPRVAGFDGRALAGGTRTRLFNDFFVFEDGLRNGVYLAAGDIDGDGFADLIVGAGPGGAPRVVAFAAQTLLSGTPGVSANFFAGDVSDRGGVPVAAVDVDGDGRTEVLTGVGRGSLPRVRFSDPRTGATLDEFAPQYQEFRGGIQVGS